MTAQLSREIVENLLQHNDESGSPANAEAWEVNALCRLALAGMDSDPVAISHETRDFLIESINDSLGQDSPSELDYQFAADIERLLQPIYTAPPAPVTGVDDDVHNIIGLLEINEWAEHCTSTVLGSRLESEITRLVGEKQPAPVAVPDLKELEAILDWILMLPCPTPKATHFAKRLAVVIDTCRAAMLKAGPVTEATVPDGLASSVKCWCRTCRPVDITDMRFVVCPDCGNKRCPRANDHRNACSGSNEPGRVGSAYPAAP